MHVRRRHDDDHEQHDVDHPDDHDHDHDYHRTVHHHDDHDNGDDDDSADHDDDGQYDDDGQHDHDDHLAGVRSGPDVDQLQLQWHADPSEQLHLVHQRLQSRRAWLQPGHRSLRLPADPVHRRWHAVHARRTERLCHVLANRNARDYDVQHSYQRVGDDASVVRPRGQ